MASSREHHPSSQQLRQPASAEKAPAAQDRGPRGKAAGDPGDRGLDPEGASQLQGTWGNEFVNEVQRGERSPQGVAGSGGAGGAGGAAGAGGGVGGPGGGLAGAQSAEAGLEEEVAPEAEVQTELEEARGNTAAAAGAALGGGGGDDDPTRGGAEIEAPWSAGRWFGGDDEPGAAPTRPIAPWRPPLPFFQEEEAAEDTPAVEARRRGHDPSLLPTDDARAALGLAPLPTGLLNRGLRHPERLTRRNFDAWDLAHDSPFSPFGRARAAARFAAEAAPGPLRPLAAVLAGGGPWLAPEAGGYAGATARALGGLDILLAASLPRPAWEAVLLVATDRASRPRVEHAAAQIDGHPAWGALALFDAASGTDEQRPLPDEIPEPEGAAALAAALALAGAAPRLPAPRPLDPDPPPPPDDPLAALVRASLTPLPRQVSPAPVFHSWNRLLAALSEVHVELAAAALSARQAGADLDLLRITLAWAAHGLRRATAGAVQAGEAADRARDRGGLDVATAAFAQARGEVERLRAEARLRIGAALLPERRVGVGANLPQLRLLAEHSRRAGAALSRRDGPGAEAAGLLLTLGARVAGLPFALADGALAQAAGLALRGARWQPPLRQAALWLTDRHEGGALNLLVAGWATLGARL